jgi:hypothetical protein
MRRHPEREKGIALVHDQVHGKRCRLGLGMFAVVRGQGFDDLGEPFVEHLGRPGVERRHRADHTRLALRDDEPGGADDEHRRTDHGQGEVAEEGLQFHDVDAFQAVRRPSTW